MNIKKLLKDKILNIADKKATKVSAGIFAATSLLADIGYSIRVDGFQWHDLLPLLSLEGIGALGFGLVYIVKYLNNR